jgi:DNA-binding response OmpR family regulator
MAVKVLIAEDEPAVAENLEALLRAKGYETKWVADGAQAVAAAKRDRPDVMLLDIMLPKMDGFDVCRLLRADPATQKVKIIVVTGLGRMGDVETAFASGATDYIIKPFDSDRLFKKIEKVLQSPS